MSVAVLSWFFVTNERSWANITAAADDFPSSGRARVDLAEGTIIASAYQIIRLIGRGGMGEVYLAKHSALNKNCALKVIPPEQVTAVGWQRFQNEARLFAKVDHPNLVRVSDLGIHDGCLPFYAMEYVDGQTLADRLALSGPLSLTLAVEIFMQVCDGVDFAHRNGIIHRDLKPANIMIARSGTGQRQAEKIIVKVLDFGLAKLTQHDRDQQSLTAVGDVFGSPFYMSPEQCAGDKIDNRSDVYSVGCALFEALTERPPFDGHLAVVIMKNHQFDDPPSLESILGPGKIPVAMEVVVAKLLRKNPAERYQTMAELKGDLERVARGESVQPFYLSRTKSAALSEVPEAPNWQREAGKDKPVGLFLAGGLAAVSVAAAVAVVVLLKSGGSSADPALERAAKDRLPSDAQDAAVDKDLADLRPGHTGVSEQAGSASQVKDLTGSDLTDASTKPHEQVEWDKGRYFQGITKSEGKEFKTWLFPVSTSNPLGFLTLGDEHLPVPMDNRPKVLVLDNGRLPDKKEMVGAVTIPVGQKVSFWLKAAILEWPDLLLPFVGANFDRLILPQMTAGQFDQLTMALASLQSINGLLIGAITDEQLPFESRVVHVINQFPKLISLSITRLFDGRSLAGIFRLKALEELSLFEVKANCDQVFASLKGSTQLTRLHLQGCLVGPSACRDLATCPNLQSIVMLPGSTDAKIEYSQIAELANLKKLSRLELGTLCYSRALIDNLSLCQSLKQLICHIDDSWTDEDKLALRTALPNTRIGLRWPLKHVPQEEIFVPWQQSLLPFKPVVTDGKPFSRFIVTLDGVRFRSWEFPEASQESMGFFQQGDPPVDAKPLSGPIAVPFNVRVGMAPSPGILDSPSVLKSFNSACFNELTLRNMTGDQFVKMSGALAKLQAIDGLHIINIAQRPSSDQDYLTAVNRYPHLTRLQAPFLDGLYVTKISSLKMLKDLSLYAIRQNIDDVAHALAGSSSLERLDLFNDKMSASAFRDICTCPNITILQYSVPKRDTHFEEHEMAPLANLRKLSFLLLGFVPYSPGLIDDLHKCQWLKTLKLKADLEWTPEQKMALRTALPKSVIMFILTQNGHRVSAARFEPLDTSPGSP